MAQLIETLACVAEALKIVDDSQAHDLPASCTDIEKAEAKIQECELLSKFSAELPITPENIKRIQEGIAAADKSCKEAKVAAKIWDPCVAKMEDMVAAFEGRRAIKKVLSDKSANRDSRRQLKKLDSKLAQFQSSFNDRGQADVILTAENHAILGAINDVPEESAQIAELNGLKASLQKSLSLSSEK